MTASRTAGVVTVTTCAVPSTTPMTASLTNAPASPPTSLTAMIAPSAASLARLPAPRPTARVPLAATDAAARTTLPVISLLRPRWLRSSVSLTCSLTPLRGIPWSAHVAHARCAANRCQPELHAKRNEPYFAVDSGEYLRSVVSCQLARNIPTRSGPFQRNTRWFSTAVRLNIASRPVAQLENLQMQTGARRRKARFQLYRGPVLSVNLDTDVAALIREQRELRGPGLNRYVSESAAAEAGITMVSLRSTAPARTAVTDHPFSGGRWWLLSISRHKN